MTIFTPRTPFHSFGNSRNPLPALLVCLAMGGCCAQVSAAQGYASVPFSGAKPASTHKAEQKKAPQTHMAPQELKAKQTPTAPRTSKPLPSRTPVQAEKPAQTRKTLAVHKPVQTRRASQPRQLLKPRKALQASAAASPAHMQRTAVEPPAAPAVRPAPVLPAWPVNKQPTPAVVTWDSHGLRIEAQNSSLRQILQDTAVAIGARVEGIGSDERVFGNYGPGDAREVLSELMKGSSYNVLMVGDQGRGAPLQIVLSTRQPRSGPRVETGGTPPEEEAEADDQGEQQPVPVAQPPEQLRPGFGPGGQFRNNPQTMREMQIRQDEMRRVQENQQQNGVSQPEEPN